MLALTPSLVASPEPETAVPDVTPETSIETPAETPIEDKE
jgi:hypothetical protein